MILIHNRVRPMSYALAIAGLCFAGLLGCDSKEEKVESAREDLREEREEVAEEQRDVADATQELNEAQRQARAEWQQDYLAFKREMVDEIAQNEKLILEKREEMINVDAQHKEHYNTAIAEAERRNNELRDRLNNATDQGDELWTQFKEGFRTTVNQVEESIQRIDDTPDTDGNG